MDSSGRINVEPTIWGEHFWMIIHTSAISYPMNPTAIDKKYFKNFYYSMKVTIPCQKCRNAFS